VSSGRHAIYIVGLSVFFWDYLHGLLLLGIEGGIHVAGSREKKGVRLYGKYDYYLICTEKLVRSCGVVIRFLLSRRWVDRP
jgi:hypothetical protein